MSLVTYLLGYQIYFWSNENGEPVHFHIAKGRRGENNTKFWILSDGSVILAKHNGHQSIKDVKKILKALQKDKSIAMQVVEDWKHNFGYVRFIR